jgi:hypothetical protein
VTNDAIGVNEVLLKERLAKFRPGMQEAPERWVELDGEVIHGRAEHYVSETRSDQVRDDFARWLATPAQAGAAAMGQFHGVIAGDVESPVVLADDPGICRKMRSDPLSDRVGRLASREEIRNRFDSKENRKPIPNPDDREACLKA